MLRMERLINSKQLKVCFYAVLLFALVHGAFSMVVPGAIVSSARHSPITDSDVDDSNEARLHQTDIFDIILKANAKNSHSHSQAPHGQGNAKALFQGDILMTKEQRLALKNNGTDTLTLSPRTAPGRAVTGDNQAKWPAVNGLVLVPYVIEKSSAPDRSVIHQALSHWTDVVPCIAFVPRTAQDHYLSFFSGQGCYSWVGRKRGKQRISIGPGCKVMGVIAHEMGHALGFWHEQSRPDRDRYVRILWKNIQSDHFDDFKMIDDSDSNDLGVEYDLASLMHYGPKAFSKSSSLNTIVSLDGSTNFGQRNGLSDKDIKQARLLYCNGSSVCRHKDLNTNCPWWADVGYCHSTNIYYPYMNKNCKRSCYCSYVCEDKADNCPSPFSWKILCRNKYYKKYMSVFCRKSCHLCAT